jgi:hypothetical protein
VELLGWPHAFNVLQIEDQQRPARSEAWTWFDSGLTYIFVDGEFRFVEPASGLVPEVQPTRLRPHRFVLGLSPAGVRSLSPGTRWESLPLLVDLPGVSLFLTDDFAASFHNGALVGIETQLPPGLLEEGQ